MRSAWPGRRDGERAGRRRLHRRAVPGARLIARVDGQITLARERLDGDDRSPP
jgi:hypothetical protein